MRASFDAVLLALAFKIVNVLSIFNRPLDALIAWVWDRLL